VTHQDVLDVVLLENLVIDRQHRAARIAEYMLHTLILERRSTISAPVISRFPTTRIFTNLIMADDV
jgi:hypothetical protein